MVKSRPFQLHTDSGRMIHGIVDATDRSDQQPVVVICHGFKGFMEWGFFPYLAELLAQRGFVAVRFNFSGSGMMPGDQLVTQPESFRQATFSRDREDLEAVLAAVGNELAAEQSDPNRIGLIGHSRGGGDAILAAGFGSQRERLKALVTWSAVSTFDRLSKAEKDQWRQNESITVVNARTGQKLPVHVAVLEDLERKGDALIPLHAAEQVRAPWLIIHGGEDETVNAGEARLLAQAAKKSRSICELQILDEAGHTFGAQHPFVGPTPDLITAMNATQTWLRRYLVPANSDR